MGLFDFLNPAKGYKRKLAGNADFFGGVSRDTLNRGLPMLWNTATSSGLTPGQQAVKSGYDADLLAGFQRALAETLRGNQERGTSNSLLDMGTRTAFGRAYSQDRARNTGNLLQMSEQQRQAILQFLMSLGMGAGGQAQQGWQTAGNMALAGDPFRMLMETAGQIGSAFAGAPRAG